MKFKSEMKKRNLMPAKDVEICKNKIKEKANEFYKEWARKNNIFQLIQDIFSFGNSSEDIEKLINRIEQAMHDMESLLKMLTTEFKENDFIKVKPLYLVYKKVNFTEGNAISSTKFRNSFAGYNIYFYNTPTSNRLQVSPEDIVNYIYHISDNLELFDLLCFYNQVRQNTSSQLGMLKRLKMQLVILHKNLVNFETQISELTQ